MGEPDIPVQLNAVVTAPLDEASIWMKISAVFYIFIGSLACLTVIGAVVGWIPLIMGIRLYQSANLSTKAHMLLSPEAHIHSLAKLKSFMIFNGVLSILGILYTVAYIGIIIFVIFARVRF